MFVIPTIWNRLVLTIQMVPTRNLLCELAAPHIAHLIVYNCNCVSLLVVPWHMYLVKYLSLWVWTDWYRYQPSNELRLSNRATPWPRNLTFSSDSKSPLCIHCWTVVIAIRSSVVKNFDFGWNVLEFITSSKKPATQ